jgi:electron transfer flavoprotein beta subunit
MSYRMIVLVKQVPDTANISGQVMKPDGTVNRAMLSAVFNPEDKVALELALQIRDNYGGEVIALSMGPPKASELLRECLYMGADKVVLISDRKFAGADTLATSYVLSEAIKKIGSFDMIFAGRQAIDGDTAQVGPQTAEKLGIPQITYAEKIIKAQKKKVTIRRRIDGGHEVLECPLPVLITVIKDAAIPRPFKATRVMAFKNARSLVELEKIVEGNSLLYLEDLKDEYISRSLFIETLTMDELKIEQARCGLHGSPTKVFKIESVILGGGEHIKIEPTNEGMGILVDKLMDDHIFG